MFKINNDEIKLILSDVDGTIYSLDYSKNKVDLKYNRKWIKKALKKNIYFALNTGNSPCFMHWLIKDLTGNIKEYNKYFISCNGNLICDFKKDKAWTENIFDKKIIFLIIDILKKFDIAYDITTINGDKIYYSDQSIKSTYIKYHNDNKGHLYHLDLTDEILNNLEGSLKISAVLNNLKEKPLLQKFIDNEFNKLNVKALWWAENGIDLVIKGTNKFVGIQNLLKIINKNQSEKITLDNVLFFGDNFNDMSVFDNLKYCIAVGNAVEEIKAKAFDVSCNANDGAIGYYLEKIWKNNKKLK